MFLHVKPTICRIGKRLSLIVAFACPLLQWTTAAIAQTAGSAGPVGFDQGRTEFQAFTYENYGAFRNGNGQPARAAVTLGLPANTALAKDGKFPVVVIAHSIGGWKDGAEGVYVKPLLAAGFAVAGMDHFGPRGITRAADVPGAISPITPVSDALLALKQLAQHPKLDPARIGVMGLSMGGITSELTAYEFVRRKVLGAESPLKFAAHLPLYAPCGNIEFTASGPVTTGAPMLKLYGGKDETTPREKCERVELMIKSRDPEAQRRVIWYPEAYHAWENAEMKPRFFPHHVNGRKCPIMDFGDRIRFIDPNGTERPFSAPELQACIKESTGYSMGSSPEAAADALKQVLTFFGETLKP